MLPEKNNLKSKNKNTPFNIDNDLINKVLTDLEKDFSINDNKIPSTISSIKKKVASNQINSENLTNKKVSDVDLLTSMTKRLNIVEKQLSDERKKSKEAESRIQILVSEIQILKEELNIHEKSSPEKEINCINCKKLKKSIDILTNYTEELREFLKENGFIILNPIPSIDGINTHLKDDYAKRIMDNSKIEINPKEEYEEDHDEYYKILPKEIDIAVLSRRIEELNMLILRDGQVSEFVMDEDKIFKLKRQKEIKIFFYNDGIIIEGFKFYEYNSVEAKRILHDILDGYTPYTLKNNFPNGVLLSPVNNLHKTYNKIITSNEDTHQIKSLNDPITKKEKISGDEFLKKFPEKVIKNGKIYNIREDMEKFLVNRKDNEYNLDANEYYLNFDKEKDELNNLICKLKIKIICIDRIITINVLKNERMNAVFDFLRKFLNSFGSKIQIEKYCFFSTFPYKVFNYEDNKTIEENGLYPSYFLIFDLNEKFSDKK